MTVQAGYDGASIAKFDGCRGLARTICKVIRMLRKILQSISLPEKVRKLDCSFKKHPCES